MSYFNILCQRVCQYLVLIDAVKFVQSECDYAVNPNNFFDLKAKKKRHTPEALLFARSLHFRNLYIYHALVTIITHIKKG